MQDMEEIGVNMPAKKTIPTRRNGLYYIKWLDEIKKLASVTEVLKANAKPALVYWTGQQAARIALDDPSLTEKEVMLKVGEISRKAAVRGRTVHSLTEAYDTENSTINVNKIWPEIREYLKAFNKFKADVKPKLLFNEQIVFNNTKGYAGTLDRIYKIDNKTVLADIKTSSAFYPDMAFQTSAYKHAEYIYTKEKEVKPMPRIDQMMIILLGKDGTYALKEMPDAFSEFLNLKMVWAFMNPEKSKEVS